MPTNPPETAAHVKALARAQGFELAGIAAVPPDGRAPEAERLAEWLAQGHHGPLKYMARTGEARQNVHLRFPWVRSVLCVGAFYEGPSPDPFSGEARDRADARAPSKTAPHVSAHTAARPSGPLLLQHVARYAWGADYHKVLEKALKRLARALREAGLCHQTRGYVDTGPIFERAWAQAAGLGWSGKNTCLIHPHRGSYFVLGVVLLDAELPSDPPVPNHCGSCTRCLDACPTGALRAPGVLDAQRCISCWTLEQKNLLPQERWPELAGWVAGCDTCQAVCPHNRARARRECTPGFPKLTQPMPWHTLTLSKAAHLTEPEWDALFRGSALRRLGWRGLRLGALTALAQEPAGNPELDWAALAGDQDPEIRARAAWVRDQLQPSERQAATPLV